LSCRFDNSAANRGTLRADTETAMLKLFAVALTLLAGPAIAHAQTFKSSAGDLKVETVAGGLSHPWALAFLPDGRMLVTERPGRMRIATADGKLSPPLQGVPKVYAYGQGGLHDVVPDRNFAQNKTIYFCFAEPEGRGARTAMARATLGDGRLDDVRGPSIRRARCRAAIISAAASRKARTAICS
jgi:aldose sugar dehydrogenase